MRKHRDERGLFLGEAMMALCVFTLLLIVAMPILMHTYKERQLIRQNMEAISLIRYHLMAWKSGSSTLPPPKTTSDFQVVWLEKSDHDVLLKVHWNDGSRSHELTGEAIK